MIGIYFSGTGNSRYALERFLREYNNNSVMFSVEDENLIEQISYHDEIIFSYPVQYSAVPKYLSDFVHSNSEMWKEKNVFIIATMALFSGDGAGVLGRLLKQYGAKITGGLHLKMPDSITDEKVLKRSHKKNIQLVKNANSKIVEAIDHIKNGKHPQDGLGLFPRLAGFLLQRLWFGHRTRQYSNQLKIDTDKCIGCSKCVKICPTENIIMDGNKAKGNDKCTVCYRCVNSCPKQAITLLGRTVIEQTFIEKYL